MLPPLQEAKSSTCVRIAPFPIALGASEGTVDAVLSRVKEELEIPALVVDVVALCAPVALSVMVGGGQIIESFASAEPQAAWMCRA